MSHTEMNFCKEHEIDSAYENYYKKRDSDRHIYPVEFVVRVFLGTYPLLKMDKENYSGKQILDLGYGDGRNFPLLNNLGFSITGVEISEHINELAKLKFSNLGIPINLKVGRNSSIPFDNQQFDYVLACHAIYYVDEGESFAENLKEVARVMKHGGRLIASLPKTTGTITQNTKPLGDGHVEITCDPLGLRNGTIFRVFETKQDIIDTFGQYFENLTIGGCDDEYFGIQQNVWTLVCDRNNYAVT